MPETFSVVQNGLFYDVVSSTRGVTDPLFDTRQRAEDRAVFRAAEILDAAEAERIAVEEAVDLPAFLDMIYRGIARHYDPARGPSDARNLLITDVLDGIAESFCQTASRAA